MSNQGDGAHGVPRPTNIHAVRVGRAVLCPPFARGDASGRRTFSQVEHPK